MTGKLTARLVSANVAGSIPVIPLIISLLYLAAVALSWSSANSFFDTDTPRYLDAAMNFAETGKLILVRYQLYFPQMLDHWQPRYLTEQPPLYPVLIALLFKLAAIDTLTAAHIISAFSFVALPFVLWGICNKTLTSQPTLLIACFLLISSLHVLYQYSLYPMSESLALVFLYGGIYLTLEFTEKLKFGEKSVPLLLTSAFILGLSVSVRFSNAFVLPGVFLCIILLAFLKNNVRTALVWVFLTSVIASLPFLVWFILPTDISLPKVGPLQGFIGNVKSLVFVTLDDILSGGIGLKFFANHHYFLALFYFLVLVVIFFMALSRFSFPGRSGLFAALSNERLPELLISLCLISYSFFIVVATSTQTLDPVNTRYIYIIYPIVILLVFSMLKDQMARGFSSPKKSILLLLFAMVIILNIKSSLALNVMLKQYDIPEYRKVRSWVEHNVGENDIILTSDAWLGYWLNRAAWYLPTQKFHGRYFTKKDNIDCVHASKRVWLILTAKTNSHVDNGFFGKYIAQMKSNKNDPLYRMIERSEEADIFLLESNDN